MTIISSWNVNSIRVRVNHVIKFIEEFKPDILLIQEIKCINEEFPDFYSNLGYESIISGQKAKYGVATIFKNNLIPKSIEINNEILNSQSRIQVMNFQSLNLNVINLYTPNGNPLTDLNKFDFKLKWYEEVYQLIKKFTDNKQNLLVGGDFNVIENIKDALNFKDWENDALGHIKVRSKFREFLSLGLTNLTRIFYRPGQIFSFWDYQRGSWERNDGILIDHFLITPKILQKVASLSYESKYRGLEKPSDHIPFWIELNI